MRNRQVTLTSRPKGIPDASHFAVIETTVPSLGQGQILIENVFLSIDPAQRGYVNDESNYAPPVALGSVMRSLAVGKVVESNDSAYPCGTYLYGWFGWQDYCVCDRSSVLRRIVLDHGPLAAHASVFGINGLTAYLALHEIAMPKPGETVIVTAAAGGVGAMVGQLARQAGCRTIAVVGSNEKGRSCIESYGYDAYLNYREPLEAALQALCPDGIDVFFDNIGGQLGDLIFREMRAFGRVVQCGTLSIPSWVPPPQGPRRERDILTKRLRVEGFVIFDHVARYDAVVTTLADLIASGKLVHHEDVERGLERAPQALVDVYAGRNHGKKLIQLR